MIDLLPISQYGKYFLESIKFNININWGKLFILK
jgi:hypothetical protein